MRKTFIKQLLSALAMLVGLATAPACNNLSVSSGLDSRSSVIAIDKISVSPGDDITITGKNFGDDIQAFVGDTELVGDRRDSMTATFTLPDTLPSQEFTVSVKKGKRNLTDFHMINSQNLGSASLYSGKAEDLCDDVLFRTVDGAVERGTRKCGQTADTCSQDGETNCVAAAAFPAVLKQGLEDKIAESQILGGVEGKAKVRAIACQTDAETECYVDGTTSIALLPSSISTADIRTGKTIAGVVGTMSATPCSSDGQINCVAASLYPALDLVNGLQANASKIRTQASILGIAGGLQNCSADGATNCVVIGPSYAAAQVAGGAAKIALGQSLGGITGSAILRPADCANEGSTNCVATATFPAVDLTALNAHVSGIKRALTIAGVSGTLDDCTSGNATSCVTNANYPSIDKTHLQAQAANIRSSLTLNSVIGTLADCASDGGTNCVASSTYPVLIKSGAAAKILSGSTVGGIAGTAPTRPSDCTTDGATGCVSTSTFPAVDTTLIAAKVLASQVVAGVTGTAQGRPADCANDGDTGCVATANFPAISKSSVTAGAPKFMSTVTIAGLPGSLVSCAADGASGCVIPTTNFAAAVTSGLAAKVISGQTLAGIAGTAPLRPADCALDGGTDCVAVAAYPSALAAGAAARIASGQTLAGIAGTATGPRPSDCTNDGDTDCITTAAYPGMMVSGAAAKIALGDTLGGVAGSATVRPSDCSIDGGTSCVATSTYPALNKNTLSSNLAKIDSSLSILGLTGTLTNCSSDGDTSCIAATGYPAARLLNLDTKVIVGNTVAGVAGAVAGMPANCAAGGAVGCVAVTNYPAIDKNAIAANASKIRASYTLLGTTGSLSDCTSDGRTNCVTTSTYPSADISGAASKILTGSVLAGVNGSAALKPSDCSADGSIDCVTVTDYPAIDTSHLNSNASKIHSSITLAGVTGTLNSCTSDGQSSCYATGSYLAGDTSGAAAKITVGSTLLGIAGTAAVKPANCAADAAVDCVANSNFPSVDKNALTAASDKVRSSASFAGVTGTMANCSADGTVGCYTMSLYPSALKSGAAAKILTGQTLAGVAGTAGIKPANCSAGQATECVATSSYPAIDMTALGNKTASILSSYSVNGVSGTLANCTADNTTDCLTSATVPAVQKSKITADVVKNGTALFGVTGAYPSSTYPLSTGDAVTDLSSSPNSQLVNSASFGWFDRTGTRYTQTGDTHITAANIKSGVSLFGVTGTMSPASPICSADGQTGCAVISANKWRAGQVSNITAWDVRYGTTIAGLVGKIRIIPNMATTSFFDRTTGTGAVTGLDVYDTIDDYMNNSTMPTTSPTGWVNVAGNQWVMKAAADDGSGGGTASNGVCDGSEACIFTDLNTGIDWIAGASAMTWENAITSCNGLTAAGLTGWRLPTQKEIMQAYIDGIRMASGSGQLGIARGKRWTASSQSGQTTNAWYIWPDVGYVDRDDKGTSNSFFCIRP